MENTLVYTHSAVVEYNGCEYGFATIEANPASECELEVVFYLDKKDKTPMRVPSDELELMDADLYNLIVANYFATLVVPEVAPCHTFDEPVVELPIVNDIPIIDEPLIEQQQKTGRLSVNSRELAIAIDNLLALGKDSPLQHNGECIVLDIPNNKLLYHTYLVDVSVAFNFDFANKGVGFARALQFSNGSSHVFIDNFLYVLKTIPAQDIQLIVDNENGAIVIEGVNSYNLPVRYEIATNNLDNKCLIELEGLVMTENCLTMGKDDFLYLSRFVQKRQAVFYSGVKKCVAMSVDLSSFFLLDTPTIECAADLCLQAKDFTRMIAFVSKFGTANITLFSGQGRKFIRLSNDSNCLIFLLTENALGKITPSYNKIVEVSNAKRKELFTIETSNLVALQSQMKNVYDARVNFDFEVEQKIVIKENAIIASIGRDFTTTTYRCVPIKIRKTKCSKKRKAIVTKLHTLFNLSAEERLTMQQFKEMIQCFSGLQTHSSLKIDTIHKEISKHRQSILRYVEKNKDVDLETLYAVMEAAKEKVVLTDKLSVENNLLKIATDDYNNKNQLLIANIPTFESNGQIALLGNYIEIATQLIKLCVDKRLSSEQVTLENELEQKYATLFCNLPNYSDFKHHFECLMEANKHKANMESRQKKIAKLTNKLEKCKQYLDGEDLEALKIQLAGIHKIELQYTSRKISRNGINSKICSHKAIEKLESTQRRNIYESAHFATNCAEPQTIEFWVSLLELVIPTKNAHKFKYTTVHKSEVGYYFADFGLGNIYVRNGRNGESEAICASQNFTAKNISGQNVQLPKSAKVNKNNL